MLIPCLPSVQGLDQVWTTDFDLSSGGEYLASLKQGCPTRCGRRRPAPGLLPQTWHEPCTSFPWLLAILTTRKLPMRKIINSGSLRLVLIDDEPAIP